MPGYLTNTFHDIRDSVSLFDGVPIEERTSFHEIRGLASRISLDLGRNRKAVQAMLTHASAATTRIYTSGGQAALRIEDYKTVEVPFSLAEMIG